MLSSVVRPARQLALCLRQSAPLLDNPVGCELKHHTRTKASCGNYLRSFAASITIHVEPAVHRAGTADLCDIFHPESVDETVADKQMEILQPIFRDFGGKSSFSGIVSTVKCFENNPLVRKALEESGEGRVLLVDGGGSLRCALLGDQIAKMAMDNGWQGVIVNGCIRDSADIGRMDIGVKAVNTSPLKSAKRDEGLRDVPVVVGGIQVNPGNYIYADKDGVIVSKKELLVRNG